jgi:putative protein-disulfide isomerase
MHNPFSIQIIYVFDALCGWCYGFSRTITQFASAHPELQVEVLSGGLYRGERVRPVREFAHIPDANRRITEATGAVFGEAYECLLTDGDVVMNSEMAATGLITLRRKAPERSIEIAAAIQRAFYFDGLALSEPATYETLAKRLGLDELGVANDVQSGRWRADAQSDFERVKKLGATSYPSIFAVLHGEAHNLCINSRDTCSTIEERVQMVAEGMQWHSLMACRQMLRH